MSFGQLNDLILHSWITLTGLIDLHAGTDTQILILFYKHFYAKFGLLAISESRYIKFIKLTVNVSAVSFFLPFIHSF